MTTTLEPQLPFIQGDRRIRFGIDDDVDQRRDFRRSCPIERRPKIAWLLHAYALTAARPRNRRVINRLELTCVGVIAIHRVFRVPLIAEFGVGSQQHGGSEHDDEQAVPGPGAGG